MRSNGIICPALEIRRVVTISATSYRNRPIGIAAVTQFGPLRLTTL
jgi:hypothetical protein